MLFLGTVPFYFYQILDRFYIFILSWFLFFSDHALECMLMQHTGIHINESWPSVQPKNIRICEHVIKKETQKRRCSYVELVADGPQIPDYCALTLCDFIGVIGRLLTVKYLYPDLTCFDQMIWRMKVCDIMYSTTNILEQRTFFSAAELLTLKALKSYQLEACVARIVFPVLG